MKHLSILSIAILISSAPRLQGADPTDIATDAALALAEATKYYIAGHVANTVSKKTGMDTMTRGMNLGPKPSSWQALAGIEFKHLYNDAFRRFLSQTKFFRDLGVRIQDPTTPTIDELNAAYHSAIYDTGTKALTMYEFCQMWRDNILKAWREYHGEKPAAFPKSENALQTVYNEAMALPAEIAAAPDVLKLIMSDPKMTAMIALLTAAHAKNQWVSWDIGIGLQNVLTGAGNQHKARYHKAFDFLQHPLASKMFVTFFSFIIADSCYAWLKYYVEEGAKLAGLHDPKGQVVYDAAAKWGDKLPYAWEGISPKGIAMVSALKALRAKKAELAAAAASHRDN